MSWRRTCIAHRIEVEDSIIQIGQLHDGERKDKKVSVTRSVVDDEFLLTRTT